MGHFLPDQRYDAVVADAGLTQSKDKGTPCLWFRLRVPESEVNGVRCGGGIEHKIWITGNTVERAAETMQKCFGLKREQLASRQFLEALGTTLAGAEVSITTKEEEDKKGNVEVVVQWMNPRGIPKAAATTQTVSNVASLFGGKAVGGNEPPPMPPFPDSETPF